MASLDSIDFLNSLNSLDSLNSVDSLNLWRSLDSLDSFDPLDSDYHLVLFSISNYILFTFVDFLNSSRIHNPKISDTSALLARGKLS